MTKSVTFAAVTGVFVKAVRVEASTTPEPEEEVRMKVGFTGTRMGMSQKQKDGLAETIAELHVTEFHHGDCIGADAEADGIAAQIGGCKIIIHPPTDPKARAFRTRYSGRIALPKKDYLDRNHDIVDTTDVLIAAPSGAERLRSGTWATIRYAGRMGKKVIVLNR